MVKLQEEVFVLAAELLVEQEDLLKKRAWCTLMMPFAPVFVANMAVGKRECGGC